jgi:gliding motility-associated-like protein
MKNFLLALTLCLLGTQSALFAQDFFLVNEGASNDCTGVLYDTGGPDANYGDNEDHEFIICPTGNPECIEFTFEFYDLNNSGSGDVIEIFDGDLGAGTATFITELGGFSDESDSIVGAVCFRTFATTGCVSIAFRSDAEDNRTGFKAAWNCAPTECGAFAPLAIDANVEVNDLAAALTGPQARISNVTLNCPDGAFAVFNGTNTDLGLDRGVLLTNGSALDAVGPNSGGGTSTGLGAPGDFDLDSLSSILGALSISQDACILEMDVVSETDELIFDYTFGSEEYPEFTNDPGSFNDIFAFFISGPGIVGDARLNGQANIALLPNAAGTVVQIDSVSSFFNNDYYRNNRLGQSIEYDGLTSGFRGNPKNLTARADVQACETYHLKLAIADRGDDQFDSGVFISALCGGLPNLESDLVTNIDYLIEDCTDQPDSIAVMFENLKETFQTYTLEIGGTATLDVDYELPGFPSEITFPPGETNISFPLVILTDNVTEGDETIEISFSRDFGCDNVATIQILTLRLADRIDINLLSAEDEGPIFFCPGAPVEVIVNGAEEYAWFGGAGTGIEVTSINGDTILVTAEENTFLTVSGTVGSCTESITFDLVTPNATVEILNPDTINICRGDTIFLEQTNNVGNQNIIWSPQFGGGFIGELNQANISAIPFNSQFYRVSAGPNGGCAAVDSVWVDVDNFVVPQIIADTTICQGYPLPLLLNPANFTGETVYAWSPGEGWLDDSTDVNSIFTSTNDIDTIFTLIAMSENGACADTQMVAIEVTRSELAILAEDTIFRCIGDEPVNIQVSVDPFVDAGDVTWRPSTGGVTQPAGASYTVDPTGNVVYYAEGIINGCPQIDSVAVRVDSLPADMSFTVDPIKDPYCMGDTFTIRSTTYDVGDYPLITHEWLVAPGIASPQDLYNGVFFASDSALFTRINVSGACADTTTVQINVIKPPILIFNPENPVVCPGDQVQITVTFDPSAPSGTLEWEDPNGTLSCTDCLDPIATVNGDVTYTIEVTADGSECTEPSSYTIRVESDTRPTLTSDLLLCPGDSRQLIVGGINPGYTYTITGGGITSMDPNVFVTPAMTTTYTVVTSGNCGMVTDEITLEVVEDYTLSVNGPDFICEGDMIQLGAEVSTGRNGTFTWTLPGNTTSNEGVISVEPMNGDVYSLTFMDALGCSVETATYTANVIGNDFSVVVTAENNTGLEIDTMFAGQTITLIANGVPDGLDVNYNWSGNLMPPTGTGMTLDVTAPNSDAMPPPPPGLSYEVIVTTVDGGCELMADINLTIINAATEIPEVISPNGDGTNDFFRVFYRSGSTVTDFTLSVFNRWGQKVFSSSDIDQGWDGTKNGTPQNMDTYLYITKFRINGELVEKDGQFSLVR